MNGQDKAAVDQNRTKRWALDMVRFVCFKKKIAKKVCVVACNCNVTK